MGNNDVKQNKILYFCTLVVIALLAFMFFPNSLEIHFVMIFVGIFIVLLQRPKFMLKKKQAWFYIIPLLVYLISIGFSSYANDIGIGTIQIIPLCFVSLLAIPIGEFMANDSKNNALFNVIFSFLIIMLVIAIFSTLYAYGLFYVYRYSSVSSSAKMLIGLQVYEVRKDVLGYISVLALAPFSALILEKKEKNYSFYILAFSCLFGLIGLLISPNVIGLAIAILCIILTLLIRFFPKEKKKRNGLLIIIGLCVCLFVIFVLLKGKQIGRIRVILEILEKSFEHPLGMGYDESQTLLNGALSSRNLFFDALYQGGWISFLSLIALWIFIAILLYKYYKKSDDESMKKNLILSFFIHYFVYVNLNYTQSIFVQEGYLLPYYLDPTFLIILILTGYLFQKAYHTMNQIEQ